MALTPVWTGVSTALTHDDAGGDPLDRAGRGRRDRALVIERTAERIHHASEQGGPDRDLDHASGRLDRVAFLDRGGVAEDDRADRLLLEVEGHAHQPVGELEQLRRQRAGQPVDLGDPVADLDDGPDTSGLDARIEVVDRGLDDAGDLVGTNGHRCQFS